MRTPYAAAKWITSSSYNPANPYSTFLQISSGGGPLEDVERLVDGLELEEGPVKFELDGFVPEICIQSLQAEALYNVYGVVVILM